MPPDDAPAFSAPPPSSPNLAKTGDPPGEPIGLDSDQSTTGGTGAAGEGTEEVPEDNRPVLADTPEQSAARAKRFREQYRDAVEFYRLHPGKYVQCGGIVGVNPKTARRWWCGPISKFTPWATPAAQILRYNPKTLEPLADKVRADIEHRAALELLEEIEKRKASFEEARRIEDAVLRAARNDVLRGLVALSRCADGVDAVAQRVGEMLKRGTDAQGLPLNISPREGMALIRSFALSTRQMVEATESLVAIDRIRQGLPTDITQVNLATGVSLQDARESHAAAGRALSRAEALGLAVHNGGLVRKAAGDEEGPYSHDTDPDE